MFADWLSEYVVSDEVMFGMASFCIDLLPIGHRKARLLGGGECDMMQDMLDTHLQRDV